MKKRPISSKKLSRIKSFHPFLLLEVIFALTLASSFLLYALISPIQIYQTEKQQLKATEYERIIDLSFGEIREKLYLQEKNLTLEKIINGDQFTLPSIQLNLPGLKTEIERSYSFKVEKSDEPKHNTEGEWLPKKKRKLEEARHLLLNTTLILKVKGEEPITVSEKIFISTG